MRYSQILPRLIAATTAASLLAVPAPAQELDPGMGASPQDALNPGAEDLTPLSPNADQSDGQPPIRTTAPNTDQCPHAERPEKPVTTSERLAPGQTSPTPPPPVKSADCGVTVPPGFDVDDDVVASAWMVSDVDTGEIISEKDPDGRYRPASIIKVLLALEVIDDLDLDKKVTVSEESANADGSAVGIGAGGEYTVDDLLHGLLMASGNDAAHALAQELGGDKETLRRVNKRAQDLGATSTYVASYSGLDAPGMQTTAHDLSLMYKAAFHNPVFADIVSTESTEFPGYDEHPAYELGNDNGLLLNDDDGIGGKTGYTDDAHHTFAGAMNRDGRRLQAIILDTTIEHGPRAWQQAQKLLHEAYTVKPGDGVGYLDANQDSTGQAAGATELPAAKPSDTDSGIGKYGPWIGAGAIGVIALAAIAAAALLPRRSRGRHANR